MQRLHWSSHIFTLVMVKWLVQWESSSVYLLTGGLLPDVITAAAILGHYFFFICSFAALRKMAVFYLQQLFQKSCEWMYRRPPAQITETDTALSVVQCCIHTCPCTHSDAGSFTPGERASRLFCVKGMRSLWGRPWGDGVKGSTLYNNIEKSLFLWLLMCFYLL